MNNLAQFPGAELVLPGLVDLRHNRETVEALLVTIAAPRLRAAGLDLPPDEMLQQDAELRLYRRLGTEFGNDAYGRYNALIRRLIAFEQAIEARLGRRP